MLCDGYDKIAQWRVVKALREFFSSVWFIILTTIIMVLSNIFGLELLAFYYMLFSVLLIVLFAEDLKGVVPIIFCAYMSISEKNNPASHVESSAFRQPVFKLQLAFILILASLALLARLITKLMNGEKKSFPKLTIGFLALGLSYMLGGLFSPYYGLRTAVFGFVEIASLALFYFLFYYTVDWKNTDKRYMFYVLTIVGLGVFAEILGMYARILLSDAPFSRGRLVTGWGMYNNVGCIVAICLPAPLYLAATQRHGWRYLLCGFVFAVALLLTQSRGSILFGGIVFLAGLVIVLVKSDKKERKLHLILIGVLAAVAIVVSVIFFKKISELFASLPPNFFDNNGRNPIYKSGWEQFLADPFFGVGFYECDGFRWGTLPADAFLPARYHDTYIQLLASGGIFAICCYLLHRIETLIVFFKRPSREKTFLFLSVAALIPTSIVDCHFFNFGPGILYSFLLVYVENFDAEDKKYLLSTESFTDERKQNSSGQTGSKLIHI